MIKIIESDIFDAKIDVLAHCCNCFCTMGSGIALAIKKRFPQVYEADLETKRGDEKKLGTISHAITGAKYPFLVVNLYAQYQYGREQRRLNYEALYCSLLELKKVCSLEEGPAPITIGFPYNIGCDRAGGSWPIVEAMIRETLKDFEVLICRKGN